MNLLLGIVRWEIDVCRQKLFGLDLRLARIASVRRVFGEAIISQEQVDRIASERSRTAGILDRLGEELRDYQKENKVS
jgi:hypothetical protein